MDGGIKRSEYLPDGWADIRFFFAVLEDGTHDQKCEVWPCSDKTRGFQRGRKPPFGTQPLEQRCSVLYLLARLAGKHGCRMMDTHILSDRETGGVLRMGMSKSPSVFISGGGYTKLPSLVGTLFASITR